jgi:tRNA pseudouridine38-40 synthase
MSDDEVILDSQDDKSADINEIDSVAVRSPTMQRWRIDIEYNGAAYCGWQRQVEGVPTVQGKIEEALQKFCQQKITIHGAGRTDAGVHGKCQVAHFDLDYGGRPLNPVTIMQALNAHMIHEDIAILRAMEVNENFHARFSARNKLYKYRIYCRTAPAIHERRMAWWRKWDLDAQAMHKAAQHVLGYHDFSTFRDAACQAKSPMRSVERLDVVDHGYDETGGHLIEVLTESRSFLHHQVRNMVGSLMMVGSQKWTEEEFVSAFKAADRTRGGQTAPAEGLYFMRVDY